MDRQQRFSKIFKDSDTPSPVELATPNATVVMFSARASDKKGGNEDAAGFWDVGPGACVLAVADGLGGTPGGALAAATAVDTIGQCVENAPEPESLRGDIIDAFEQANERILDHGIGAGTTLIVVEIQEDRIRAYHAGDSGALMVGQRGRVRLDTIPHSPVGYAVASGILEQDDTHHHDERHLLSNCIGSREMRVEIGAPMRMAANDTLLLATDGVLDNVQRQELIDLIRSGPLLVSAAALLNRAVETMEGADRVLPAHPDDATALLLRRPRR